MYELKVHTCWLTQILIHLNRILKKNAMCIDVPSLDAVMII